MVLERASSINNNLDNDIIMLIKCKLYYYYQFNLYGQKYTTAD